MNAVSKIPMYSIDINGIIYTWASCILGALAMSTTNVMLKKLQKDLTRIFGAG